MTENSKINRNPSYISGRSFSNGILLRGGGRQAVSVRTKAGEIAIEVSAVKDRNTSKTLQAFLNMLAMVVSGFKVSVDVFKMNKSFSLIRLFKYHGAEHKVIHCYEDGMELNVENAKKCSTYHPRCGSSLAANVLILEALICLIVPAKVRNALFGLVDIILFFAAFFAGFKISRYVSKNDNKVSRILSLPGKALQKITALEPDDDMLECGIEAAKRIVKN